MTDIRFGLVSTPVYYNENMVKMSDRRSPNRLHRIVGLAETKLDNNNKFLDLYAGGVKPGWRVLNDEPFALVGINFFEIPVTPTQPFPTPKHIGQLKFNDERPDHRITGEYTDSEGSKYSFKQDADSNDPVIEFKNPDKRNPFVTSHITAGVQAYKGINLDELKEEPVYETRGNNKH